MKIFVTHSSNFDFKNELYKPLRESELNNNHDIKLPQENGYEVITKDIIKNCDLIVAEVSYPSSGQGIELGWADIFNIPIVCIYKEGAKYSRSLEKLTSNFITYRDSQDLILKISDYINKINK